MNIQAVMKQEDRLIRKNKDCMMQVRILKAEIKKLRIDVPSKEGRCPLLKIAGFAEIGVVTSEEIDREVYGL